MVVVIFGEGGVLVSNQSNEPSKAEVQTTKLNKMPQKGEFDTEFSAEEAAEVFNENQSANHASDHQE
ncbi:hypothetical protein [Paenibacillus castaneae]|uniref:hypothetical protein n=1 Tax=Paenibacillus castaneae TaxID=474957 RepID=UPI000C9B4592|nr:hypothetical protein [Paenibacillus castaneae]